MVLVGGGRYYKFFGEFDRRGVLVDGFLCSENLEDGWIEKIMKRESAGKDRVGRDGDGDVGGENSESAGSEDESFGEVKEK